MSVRKTTQLWGGGGGGYITGCQQGRPQTTSVLHYRVSCQGGRLQTHGVLHYMMSVRETTDSLCFTLQDVNEGDHRQLVYHITGCQHWRFQTDDVSHYRM